MSGLTVHDIQIWMINLPRSEHRRHKMVSQLEQRKLKYVCIDAVDGRKDWDSLRSTVDIPAFERNVGRHVMPGEIGCYHSHLRVWQALCDSESDIGLVLEDDVLLHEDFQTAVEALINTSVSWDIVKLNYIRAKLPVKKAQIKHWDLYAYVGPFTGTGSYLIQRNTAERLLKSFLPISRPIDHEIDRSHKHNIRHYGLSPYPSRIDDEQESTITGSNFSKVRKFPFYHRLSNYSLRFRNSIGKLLYIARNKT